MDGLGKYETVDIANFQGLVASADPTSEGFPLNAAVLTKNFEMSDGVLRSRKGRRRLNDTAFGNAVNFIIPYTNRNNVDYLVFGVQNSQEGLETPDGAVKIESNAGLRKPLEKSFKVGESYIWDIKVRDGYVYVMLFDTAANTAVVRKYDQDGVLQGSHSFTDNENHYTFEIDGDENLYVFTQVAGTEDKLEKFVFGNSTPTASVILATGVGADAFSMVLYDNFLYVGYNDGTNAKVDKFTKALVFDSNFYSAVTADRIDSISFTRIGTAFLTRRSSDGSTRGLYYYDGASWDELTGEFINLPSRVVCRHDNVYVALVDDTVNGDSQAMMYVYDAHMNYLERMGNVYLSASTKVKPWDISSRVAGETSSVTEGRVLFDVDDEFIYFVDAITDGNLSLGLFTVIKRFRR